MKTHALACVMGCIAITCCMTFVIAQPVKETKTIEDFESLKVGKIPVTWRTWPFQRSAASQVYIVAEESGNHFLRALDAKDISVQLFRNYDWNIQEYPLLSWRWRARQLPTGAKESDPNLNDSACSIYVVLGRFEGKALKYVWSSSLAVGQTVARHEGKLQLKVVDTGLHKINTWQTHTINVLKDYQELFGEPLTKKPSGIGILTDGNQTHSTAACDYDDFVISNIPTAGN